MRRSPHGAAAERRVGDQPLLFTPTVKAIETGDGAVPACGRYPVIGAWIVGDEAAGMGIREDATPVTTNVSRFIPHFFE